MKQRNERQKKVHREARAVDAPHRGNARTRPETAIGIRRGYGLLATRPCKARHAARQRAGPRPADRRSALRLLELVLRRQRENRSSRYPPREHDQHDGRLRCADASRHRRRLHAPVRQARERTSQQDRVRAVPLGVDPLCRKFSDARQRLIPGRVVHLRLFLRRAARPCSRITAATVFSFACHRASLRSGGDPRRAVSAAVRLKQQPHLGLEPVPARCDCLTLGLKALPVARRIVIVIA